MDTLCVPERVKQVRQPAATVCESKKSTDISSSKAKQIKGNRNRIIMRKSTCLRENAPLHMRIGTASRLGQMGGWKHRYMYNTARGSWIY